VCCDHIVHELHGKLYVTCTVHFLLYKSYSDKCTLFHVIQHNFLLKTAQHVLNLFKVHLQGLICWNYISYTSGIKSYINSYNAVRCVWVFISVCYFVFTIDWRPPANLQWTQNNWYRNENPYTPNSIIWIYVAFNTRCIADVISTNKPQKMNLK
jgi:hypothetical protein